MVSQLQNCKNRQKQKQKTGRSGKSSFNITIIQNTIQKKTKCFQRTLLNTAWTCVLLLTQSWVHIIIHVYVGLTCHFSTLCMWGKWLTVLTYRSNKRVQAVLSSGVFWKWLYCIYLYLLHLSTTVCIFSAFPKCCAIKLMMLSQFTCV